MPCYRITNNQGKNSNALKISKTGYDEVYWYNMVMIIYDLKRLKKMS